MIEGKDARDIGYENNKDVIFKQINGIHIERFRSLRGNTLPLGKNITLISGKNGTMKTSLLGLIAHPFTSKNDAKDHFGADLKTKRSDVFKLSLENDTDIYRYFLDVTTIKEERFCEPIRLYIRDSYHRVTVGKDNSAGLGNFHLNTSYVNLKRLYPILETTAKDESTRLVPTPSLLDFIADGHRRILVRDNFIQSVPVAETKGRIKSTFGPTQTNYDFTSMSSGEDNLGHILTKMHAFVASKYDDAKGQLQGIFCIDEIEAGLHPVAQEKLFDFIFEWSRLHNIQVVATTHSLYLIQYALSKRHSNEYMSERIFVNMISTAFAENNNYNIISNPTYKEAYKELTYKSIDDLEIDYRINVLCEDDVAVDYLKKIIKTANIKKRLNFMYGITDDASNPGTSWSALQSIVKNGAALLKDTIVVFDGDVNKKFTSNNVELAWLPSMGNLPVEKEIVKFIYDLPGHDPFFKKFNRERESFLSDIYNHKIKTLDSMDAIKSSSTNPFKNWAKSDRQFTQYVTYYVNTKPEYIQSFRKQFIESINKILESKSLPTFDD